MQKSYAKYLHLNFIFLQLQVQLSSSDYHR